MNAIGVPTHSSANGSFGTVDAVFDVPTDSAYLPTCEPVNAVNCIQSGTAAFFSRLAM